MFGIKMSPRKLSPVKSMFLAIMFFFAALIFRAAAAFGHREKKQKEDPPPSWFKIVRGLLKK